LDKEDRIKSLDEEWSKISSLSNDNVKEAYIAYFDILGYHDLIKDRTLLEVCKLIEKVRILPQLTRLKQPMIEELKNTLFSYPSTDKFDYEIKSISFSDNIILSTQNNWRLLLHVMIDIQAALIKEGIFIRGAMVYGKIYHSQTLVGGEGLIKAHCIESKLAVYPRIIVDESYICAAKTASKHLGGDYILKYLKRDFDGNDFLDYLTILSGDNSDKSFMKIHKKMINAAVKKYKNKPEILAKYKWCETYHNNLE